MAHIRMRAMEKFPIEKLSYDLKSELLENMDPKDVVKLANVNQGFRSIVVKEPWRIFGKHLDQISIIISDSRNPIFIRRFESGVSMPGENRDILALCGSSFPEMKLKTFMALISKIRSVSKLLISIEAAYVNVENVVEKYFTIFALNHINTALLNIPVLEGNAKMLEFLSHFVETSLNHCKNVEIREHPSENAHLSFRYEAFAKIWTEMIRITVSSSHKEMQDFKELVHGIVTRGIPGSNPEAAILLSIFNYCPSRNPMDGWLPRRPGAPTISNTYNPIAGWLSRTPGVRQIAHEDQGEVGQILAKLIPKDDDFGVNEVEKCLREGVYFTRSIDSNRKCIYVTSSNFFFAKYITIG